MRSLSKMDREIFGYDNSSLFPTTDKERKEVVLIRVEIISINIPKSQAN